MPRPLSSRERLVLVAMIDHAEPFDGEPRPTTAARQSWRTQVPSLLVDSVCECGDCPSVSLAPASVPAGVPGAERAVLGAGLSDALVLLFVDGGTPSYLELAPHGQGTRYTEFPDADLLEF